MSANLNGPPTRRSPGSETRATSTPPSDNTEVTTTPGTSLAWIPCTAQPAPQDTRAQIRRRREGSDRSVPQDCGCRDPWVCRHYEPPMSPRWVDAGREAAVHLLAAGVVPILDAEVLQELWRRGGADRRLAQQVHQLTAGQTKAAS